MLGGINMDHKDYGIAEKSQVAVTLRLDEGVATLRALLLM